jgi:hypothetical protein
MLPQIAPAMISGIPGSTTKMSGTGKMTPSIPAIAVKKPIAVQIIAAYRSFFTVVSLS